MCATRLSAGTSQSDATVPHAPLRTSCFPGATGFSCARRPRRRAFFRFASDFTPNDPSQFVEAKKTFQQLSACTRRKHRHLDVHLLFFSLFTARHRMSCPMDRRFCVALSESKQVVIEWSSQHRGFRKQYLAFFFSQTFQLSCPWRWRRLGGLGRRRFTLR